ncbi:hypothetical protein OCU04_010062 [Sclerotinia nivalis]|uniref:Uncharacterized protein n=1 Tax=Sclerotinia nivalis TaxID=352851 RepID=A0A9X0AEP5_9HELO|nr:hypothetical protein OCU04_010062 [Sclerotinia nivalis]
MVLLYPRSNYGISNGYGDFVLGTWAYFNCHTAPLKYLYDIDSAAAWTGYTVNQLGLDVR